MLSCNSIEGYIRPGCVHLTVDALMGYEERRALASQVGGGDIGRGQEGRPRGWGRVGAEWGGRGRTSGEWGTHAPCCAHHVLGRAEGWEAGARAPAEVLLWARPGGWPLTRDGLSGPLP